jgi:hypothetical protein
MKRRRLLLALGLGAAFAGRGPAAQGGAVVVEGGTPQRIPLTAVADLAIELGGDEDAPIDFAALTLGSIDVPSGRLAGMDALLLDGAPFSRSVEPDRYPVQLVLARLPNGDERVAFVQLKFGNRDAVRWENAAIDGDDADRDDDELAGFEVESGVACLFDADAVAGWRAALVGDASHMQALERVLRENRRPVWTWARVRMAAGSGVLITAGMGEGFYAAYWGFDRAGQIVSLVLDFDLLEWAGLPEEEPVTT